MDLLIKILKKEEGFSPTAYPDQDGWSIGYGHWSGIKPQGDITEVQANSELMKDINIACRDLRDIPEVNSIWLKQNVSGITETLYSPSKWEDIRTALICMAFQMGRSRLSGFKRMFEALETGNYYWAGGEMLDSNWAMQTPERARRMYQLAVYGWDRVRGYYE